jgi:hypothetical protein
MRVKGPRSGGHLKSKPALQIHQPFHLLLKASRNFHKIYRESFRSPWRRTISLCRFSGFVQVLDRQPFQCPALPRCQLDPNVALPGFNFAMGQWRRPHFSAHSRTDLPEIRQEMAVQIQWRHIRSEGVVIRFTPDFLKPRFRLPLRLVAFRLLRHGMKPRRMPDRQA